MWTIRKKTTLYWISYIIASVLCFFDCKACGILAPWPGIEPIPPALEREVLTTGPPGEFPPSLLRLSVD